MQVPVCSNSSENLFVLVSEGLTKLTGGYTNKQKHSKSLRNGGATFILHRLDQLCLLILCKRMDIKY